MASARGEARLLAIGAPTPREYPLATREIAIGSAADNQIVVADPTVSRHHARIVRNLSRFRLIDLDSTNGTFVNGGRIRRPIRLKGGDEIRVGAVRFTLLLPRARRGGAAPMSIRLGFGTILGLLVLLFLVGFAGMRRAIQWKIFAAPGAAPAPEVSASPARSAPSAASQRVAGSAAGGSEVKSPTLASTDASVAGGPISPPGPEPQWLRRLNYYRGLAKLPPVADDPELSKGDRAHAEYLVRNYGSTIRTFPVGPEVHTEDRFNPWFTPAGLAAAESSDIDEWYYPGGTLAVPPGGVPDMWTAARSPGTPAWSIDGWMSIPFHRLPMLSPSLGRAGFGLFCESGECAAALNVASAFAGPARGGAPPGNPIEFPPDGSTMQLRAFGAEWPDPRTSCLGFEPPSGLAVTLQLGSFIDVRLEAYSLSRLDGRAAPVEACGFDQASYANSDPMAHERVRHALNAFGAIVIVPRYPLAAGAKYQVSITAGGKPYQWTFSTAP